MPDYFDLFRNPGSTIGFVANIRDDSTLGGVYDNLKPKNVWKAVGDKSVTTDRYVLLYLYASGDVVSAPFLAEYGARLNNRLKADIPLFTVYPEAVFDGWKNDGSLAGSVHGALEEEFKKAWNPRPRYELMTRLADLYGVRNALPALVVIDGKSGGAGAKEEFAYVSFCDYYKPEAVFGRVCEVLDAIEANPNNFEAVCKVCNANKRSGNNGFAKKCAEADTGSLYWFFKNKIDKKDTTIEKCANACNMSRNTLSDYMYEKRRIKVEKLFALAFYLGMSPAELDWLFDEHAAATGDEKRAWKRQTDKRFKAIRSLLAQRVPFYEINNRLRTEGVDPINE